MMKKCVVIGGAPIENYEYLRTRLTGDEYVICCDAGQKHIEALGVEPDLIVGDFDSSENTRTNVETIVLPREKDDTDTFYAVKEALKRGFNDFLLLGVLGARLDHSFGNISILLMLDVCNAKAVAIDDFSEVQIISGEPAYIDDSFKCFSTINISGTSRHITIENAKYSLNDAEITCDYQYGISNETLPGKIAKVTVKEGRLLIIKVYNE